MKTRSTGHLFPILVSVLLAAALLTGCSTSNIPTRPNVEEISNMINLHQFVFVAERVNPLRGSSHALTSYYDVTVKRDTIRCELPYFGEAFQAPMDPSKGGLEFTSYRYSYQVTLKDKDEWQIYIDPRDEQEVQQLFFQIFGNGTATLNVVCTNRDPISFYGHIKKITE